MFKITLPADRAEVDMTAVAKGFGLDLMHLHDAIHIGTVSRWVEVGEGNQDNKPHWIFDSAKLGVRVDVDEHGHVHSVNEYKTARAETRQTAGHIARLARLDALLDAALDASFPASDPVSISFEDPHRTACR